jgi:hypothetical protein
MREKLTGVKYEAAPGAASSLKIDFGSSSCGT